RLQPREFGTLRRRFALGRFPQSQGGKGSLRWIQLLVNEHPEVLNAGLAIGPVEWRSPRADDGYAEYRDQAFLDRLRVTLANRLAHAWFLAQVNELPVRLAFVHFIGDADMDGPFSQREWQAALTVLHEALGLRGRMPRYVAEIFIDVRPAVPAVV